MKDYIEKFNDSRLSLLCATSNVMYYEYNPFTNYCVFKNSFNILGYPEELLDKKYNEKGIRFLENYVHEEDLGLFKNMLDVNSGKTKTQGRLFY